MMKSSVIWQTNWDKKLNLCQVFPIPLLIKCLVQDWLIPDSFILLDINMPEMNGYEVLKQLQNMDNFNSTQVVAISADTSPSDVKKGLEAGFSSYITKPMRMQALYEIVDNIFQVNTY